MPAGVAWNYQTLRGAMKNANKRISNSPEAVEPSVIMDYTICTGSSIQTFGRGITDLIARGYEPQGGIAVATDGTLVQAMVKRS